MTLTLPSWKMPIPKCNAISLRTPPGSTVKFFCGCKGLNVYFANPKASSPVSTKGTGIVPSGKGCSSGIWSALVGSQFFSPLLPRCCWECSVWKGKILKFHATFLRCLVFWGVLPLMYQVYLCKLPWQFHQWLFFQFEIEMTTIEIFLQLLNTLRVNARRSPGGVEFRITVFFFCIERPMMFNSSLNLPWGILIYSENPLDSLMASFLNIVQYAPLSSLLETHWSDQHLLSICLFSSSPSSIINRTRSFLLLHLRWYDAHLFQSTKQSILNT